MSRPLYTYTPPIPNIPGSGGWQYNPTNAALNFGDWVRQQQQQAQQEDWRRQQEDWRRQQEDWRRRHQAAAVWAAARPYVPNVPTGLPGNLTIERRLAAARPAAARAPRGGGGSGALGGALGGALLGGIMGGPVGAIIGSLGGALLGSLDDL